ncbi:MAG: TonB-dependent receptor, partial [Lysobacter sp.]|nr:TonB-dependent receptor [Lysobacter sp.]
VFRNDRKNYKVADLDNPANLSGLQQLDGQARVDGVMLGVSGLITDQWAVYANYAFLDSEVLQGVSNRQAGLGLDYTKGDRLTNVPEHSFSVWTTYDLNSRWQVGLGSTYQGKIWLTQHSATNVNGPLTTYGSYWTHRAMVNFKINRSASLQLNVNNLTDEEYFTRIRNNGWATPGDGRQFVLSANFAF